MILNLTVAEVAYLAGIIDGEGSITIYKYNRKPRLYSTYCLRLLITNTNKDLIYWIQSKLGKGCVNYIKSLHREKPALRYNITSGKAAEVLKLVLPYLIVKKEQAEIGIAFREIIQQSKIERHVKGHTGMVEMPIEHKIEIESMHQRIKALNKRGKGNVLAGIN